MKIKVNNNEFDSKILYNGDDDIYRIEVLDGSDVMGYATFKLKRQRYFDSVWLYKIETNKEYAHKGVGSAVINLLEYFAYQNRAHTVEGKFFPENEYAKPFYDKFGYSIEKEGYETYIYKTLDFKTIKQTIEPNITGYEETLQDYDKMKDEQNFEM